MNILIDRLPTQQSAIRHMLAALLIFVGLPSVAQTFDEPVEFVDIFGQRIGNTYIGKSYGKEPLTVYPMPNYFSSQYHLREGLADKQCVSFEARDKPGHYLLTYDEEPTSWPAFLSVRAYSEATDTLSTWEKQATFCEKGGLLYSYLKQSREYVLARWHLPADDLMVIARVRQLPTHEHALFIPLKYFRVEDAQFADSFAVTANSPARPLLSLDHNQVVFRSYNFLQESERESDLSSWFFHTVSVPVASANTSKQRYKKYFAIQNLANKKYLIKQGDELTAVPFEQTFSDGPEVYRHEIMDNALWDLQKTSAPSGDYILFNKADRGQFVQAGSVIDNRQQYAAFSRFNASARDNVTLSVHERFTFLKIVPEDIVAQSGVVYLYNGLAEQDLYTADPFLGNRWSHRKHKILIEDYLFDNKYRFVSHAGGNPRAAIWSYDRFGEVNIDLKTLVVSLPAVAGKEEREQEKIVDSVAIQLELAYQASLSGATPHARGFTPSILWLAPWGSFPDNLSETRIGAAGKILKVVSHKQNDAADSGHVPPDYGFLLQRIAADGSVSFTIDDPHPTTNDPR
ncbi:MAG: AbfB domain-containing protein [Exilibacterium sp.]